MEFKHLIYFEVAYQYKSFSKAANALFVSQQAVSKEIRRLESYLETQLFERSHSGIVATPEGELFHKRAFSIVQSYRELQRDFLQMAYENKQHLKVGLANGLSLLFCKPLFWTYMEKIPIYIEEAWDWEIEKKLKEGHLDVGIVRFPMGNPDIISELLISTPMDCIMRTSNPLATRSSLKMVDIQEHVVVMENNPAYKEAMEQVSFALGRTILSAGAVPTALDKYTGTLRDANITCLRLEADELFVCEHCIQDEQAIGLVSQLRRNDPRFNQLVHIPLEEPLFHWDIGVICNKNLKKRKESLKFINYIRKYCQAVMNQELCFPLQGTENESRRLQRFLEEGSTVVHL